MSYGLNWVILSVSGSQAVGSPGEKGASTVDSSLSGGEVIIRIGMRDTTIMQARHLMRGR